MDKNPHCHNEMARVKNRNCLMAEPAFTLSNTSHKEPKHQANNGWFCLDTICYLTHRIEIGLMAEPALTLPVTSHKGPKHQLTG